MKIHVQQEIADAVDEAAQIYKEEVPLEEQSGNGLCEVLDVVIKKTTEELGHKFNKQQSIANPTLGKQFLEEVIPLALSHDRNLGAPHKISLMFSFLN